MVLLTDPSKNSRQPNHLRKYRSTERQYLFDVAFGADSSQVWFVSFDVSFDFAQRCPNSTKSPPIFSKYPDNLKKPSNLFNILLQEEVYGRTTKPLVENVLQGYNATVFAYGATGSGKTYTMVGQPNQPGCMARALNDLFEAVDKTEDVVFKVNLIILPLLTLQCNLFHKSTLLVLF